MAAIGQQCIPLSIKLKYKNTVELIPVFIKADPEQFSSYAAKHSSRIKLSNHFNHYFSLYLTYDALVQIAKLPFVYQIQDGSMKIQPFNDSMRSKSKINWVHKGQSPLTKGYQGENILIGIIDFGLDYRHPDFKEANGQSRILSIWDQNDSIAPPNGYSYGREWTSANFINGTCYYTEVASSFGHGTHVTGIACGNGTIDSNMKGVAPKSKIIAVNLKDNNTFMNQIVDGIAYIFKKADSLNIPCVINISLGTYDGSHDGQDIATQMIDSMVLAKNGRAIVASAGNSGSYAQHITMQPNQVDTLYTYFTYTSNFQGTYLNFWADTQNMRNLKVSINADSNISYKKASNTYSFHFNTVFLDSIIKRGSYDDSTYVVNLNNDTIGIMYLNGYLQGSAINWGAYILPKNTSFIWKFCTYGIGKVDLWVHPLLQTSSAILNSGPSYPHLIYKTADYSMSLASGMQCSEHIITVGNYSTKNAILNIDQSIYSTSAVIGTISGSSSMGPTRDLKQKPELAAPGNFIQSTIDTLTRKTALVNSGMRKKLDPTSYYYTNGGTSMASPVVAGCIALFLEKNPTFDTKKIKFALTKSALADTFTGNVPNMIYGYGKMDAYNMLTYPITIGCKDTGSINYNSTADFEDSSLCIKKRYGCMDTASVNYDATANTSNSSCIPKVYGITDTSCLNFNLLANVSSGTCIPKVYGIMDTSCHNFNPLANVTSGTCIPKVYGIMDTSCLNFNPLANISSGTCIPKVYGIMDTSCLNFNPLANISSGTCIPKVYGIMDTSCHNFNPLANVTSGTCTPKVYGCTDSLASNFNPNANINNGSCIYVHSNINQVLSDLILLYPNPAQNLLKLTNKSNYLYDIKIYTNEGRLVESSKLEKELVLSIQHLAEGHYKILLEREDEKKWLTFSIVR